MKQHRLEYFDPNDGWISYGTVTGTAEFAWAVVDEMNASKPDLKWQVIEVIHLERVVNRDGSGPDRAFDRAWAAWGTEDVLTNPVTVFEAFKAGFNSGREGR
jgi:hypothetical protein